MIRQEKRYYVYISTNQRHTVLYTGFTNSLIKRSGQHKEKRFENSFTARYNVDKIIYFETYGDVHMAIDREKQIKGWVRQKKIDLIDSINPKWEDLVEKM